MGPDEEDDMIEMFTFLAANDERRPPEHTVNDGGDAVAYSVAADLRLWHERLGHTHTTALKLIYRTGSIDDFEIEDVDDPHSASCKCPTCSMTKAKFVHMPVRARDFDSDEGRPLQHIVSDVKVIGTPSLNGSKYFVTFIDTWSRHCRLYFLQKKSDVAEAWAKYLAWSKHAGYIVDTILTDNGGGCSLVGITSRRPSPAAKSVLTSYLSQRSLRSARSTSQGVRSSTY